MKTKHKLRISQVPLVLMISVFAFGCGKKNVKQGDRPPGTPQTVSDAALAVEDGMADDAEGSSRNKDYRPEAGIHTVYFDFDKSELSEEARKALQENAAALKERAGVEIQVAGHCDDRGTSGYNLALGQRRANVVRNYYKALGIRTDRLSTISYGEENPVCEEAAEECWRQNRRAATLLRVR